jgi:mono/diheme cytochrome c family protein
MRSGRLQLAAVALAAAVLGATGCDSSPGGDDQARTETGTQADPGSATPAPKVGMSGGTAAGADSATVRDTAPTPPVNARPDSTPVTPRTDTSRARTSPSVQTTRRDTAPTRRRNAQANQDTTPETAPAARTPAADSIAPSSSDTGAGRRQSGGVTGETGATTSQSGGTSGQTAAAGGGKPGKTVTQVEYTGWKQYEVNCARCHGEYGLGSTIAPSLYHSFQSGAVDSAEYQRVVHGSRIAKGMPNWTGVLSEEYLHAIYKYLAGRGAGRIAAGRPTPEG